MRQRNCPNCGAPYKVELNTCPYCGTSYFDMSAIDINEGKPFYLKLKTGNIIFTSKVVAEPEVTVNFYEDTYSALGYNVLGRYGEMGRVVVNRNIDIDMHFKSVYDPNQVLCTLEVKDDVD